MTELSTPESKAVKRILIAVDPCRQNRNALERALLLAGRMRAELIALFVEDENLLRLAGLPFACEVRRSTTLERKLDASQINRTMQRQTSNLRQLIERAAAQHNIQVSVKIVQGRLIATALTAAGNSDIAFLNTIDQRDELFTTVQSYQARHSVLQPVLVLYDASSEANRALALAAELSAGESPGLTLVLVTDNPLRVTELQQQAEQLLSGIRSHAKIQYQVIVGDVFQQLPRLISRQGCSLLVLPRNHKLLAQSDNDQMLENLGCPLVLVR